MIIHPARFRIIGTSGPSGSAELDCEILTALVWVLLSALVRSPSADDFLTGFGSTFSVLASLGEVVFALSSSPLIGRPQVIGQLV